MAGGHGSGPVLDSQLSDGGTIPKQVGPGYGRKAAGCQPEGKPIRGFLPQLLLFLSGVDCAPEASNGHLSSPSCFWLVVFIEARESSHSKSDGGPPEAPGWSS